MATPEAQFTFGPAGGPPGAGAGRGGGASTMNACFTPGSFLISSRFALIALPPNTGHFINSEEHAWRIDVDAEGRLSGNDCEIVDSRSGLPDDFKILRVLQFHRGEFGHG